MSDSQGSRRRGSGRRAARGAAVAAPPEPPPEPATEDPYGYAYDPREGDWAAGAPAPDLPGPRTDLRTDPRPGTGRRRAAP
ncbi:hypothetical protein LG632_19660, partial [Streptomyces sp. SMC 277]|nr:hypothetical protein [Streptomyces antimicrobicus]